jgi:hypothetical protein
VACRARPRRFARKIGSIGAKPSVTAPGKLAIAVSVARGAT